ncbi:MAG: hypothetical protein AAF604_19655 [Acidobacteriota bacterium]
MRHRAWHWVLLLSLLVAIPLASQERPEIGPGTEQGTPTDDGPPGESPVNPCAGKADGVRCPDDGTVCTRDICRAEQCRHEPARDGHGCEDDGNECTDDICAAGACTHPMLDNETPCTSDDNPCTADQCLRGQCEHLILPQGTVCAEDGEPCTSHTCNERARCVRSVALDGAICPSDGDCCTRDICQAGRCTHQGVRHGTPCDGDEEGCAKGGYCLWIDGRPQCSVIASPAGDAGC